MKKLLIRIILILSFLYVTFCGFFFFFQEELIFHPTKLDTNYIYKFNQKFEEINIKSDDGQILNGLLFKADSTKGVIFYLHGNAGALNTWGNIAPFYTYLGYDLFFLDYRGFGKSEGKIENQTQLFQDIQFAYDEIKRRYDEDKIIILGYSIGTGLAAYLASSNNPSLLILQAPYYRLTDVIQDICPIVPDFAVKYKLETYKYIEKCKNPIVIFHGDMDEVINYGNSVRLTKRMKDTDQFITLKGERHNSITENEVYKAEMIKILANKCTRDD